MDNRRGLLSDFTLDLIGYIDKINQDE